MKRSIKNITFSSQSDGTLERPFVVLFLVVLLLVLSGFRPGQGANAKFPSYVELSPVSAEWGTEQISNVITEQYR